MRSFLAGSFLLALCSAAWAQVRGDVESVGFGGEGLYRPDCWTPMVVRLRSQISEPAEYRIEVHQRDLDFDHVVYVKDGITLNGQAEQRWELCFLPEPAGGGLPEGQNSSLQDLQDRLRVYVTNKDGTRQLLQLPITSRVRSLDPPSATGFESHKGSKLILCVTEGQNSRPTFIDYRSAIGLIENPEFVPLRAEKLPQSIEAYQAVDAVLWVNGDARVLSEQGSQQLAALQQWVRQGGHLIVCQPADGDRPKVDPLGSMLPIQWKENGDWKVAMQEKDNLEPLLSMAKLKEPPRDDTLQKKMWRMKGPFAFARATAKPNAVIDRWIDWGAKAKSRWSPYLVRAPYGLGCVTWVAQDLGDKYITGTDTNGWPYVWDQVLGWKSDTHVPGDYTEATHKAYEGDTFAGSSVDVGYAQLQGVEFPAKGVGLIVLAIFFFIGYWVIAGPGTYLFLAGRKRKQLSWIAFGVCALGATAVTVALVRLVLRGSAEIHHATTVRMTSGQEPQPAIVYSRIGLYIPRDGSQHVELQNTSTQLVSYITPMSIYPQYVPDNEFPANLDYRVPVRDQTAADTVGIDVPFRSTLKKLQAKWCGDISTGVRANNVKFNPNFKSLEDMIAGSVDNLTGIDLKNVYIAFRYPQDQQDGILYIPSWPASGAGARIDLGQAWHGSAWLPFKGSASDKSKTPEEGKPCRGNVNQYWAFYWYRVLGHANEKLDDLTAPVPTSFPVLSFYERIPPAVKDDIANTRPLNVLRRGARVLDMSHALEAGELVVLAQADKRPLPFPLEVEGTKPGGEGPVFYQFALPIDHAGTDSAPVDTSEESAPAAANEPGLRQRP